MKDKEIIYDWNQFVQAPIPSHHFELNDETLRDGLQSPSSIDPPLEDKIRLLHLMESLGIGSADIGLPGAGPHVVRTVTALTEEIARGKMRISPNCAARTVLQDIQPIVDISQKTGIAIEVMTFIGSSPIRLYTEDWDEAFVLKCVRESIGFAVKNNLPACLVTEDTIRSHPKLLATLYTAALDAGAKRICLCDTVGHATPDGTQALIRFARNKIIGAGGYEGVKIDWHGHNDRGHAVPNALSALEEGADRVHGTGLGIGERCGNTSMDQLIVNLWLLGWLRQDVSKLKEYCELVSKTCGHPIPENYPVVGRDAFRTATGVHAAAIIKAEKKGDAWLADRIYSGVPAGTFGFTQTIEVGPVSGESNVVYWLKSRGLPAEPKVVATIFAKAKASNGVLKEDQIMEEIQLVSRS